MGRWPYPSEEEVMKYRDAVCLLALVGFIGLTTHSCRVIPTEAEVVEECEDCQYADSGLDRVMARIDAVAEGFGSGDCTSGVCVATTEWLPGGVERNLATGVETHWGYVYLCDQVLEDEQNLALECEIIREELGPDYTVNARALYADDPKAFCESSPKNGFKSSDVSQDVAYCLDAQTDGCIVYLEECAKCRFDGQGFTGGGCP
jgi:hypothetical protein